MTVVPSLLGDQGLEAHASGKNSYERVDGEQDQMVVCHGDLWNGNYLSGRIERVWGIRGAVVDANEDAGTDAEREGVRNSLRVHREILNGDFIFDAAATYAPASYDHGIMHMFGGFGGAFWKSYWTHRKEFSALGQHLPWDVSRQPGPDHPVIKLYKLYHYLNHYALFGGSYGSEAQDIMDRLVRAERKL